MSAFRKKPVAIEATRWFKDGDHPKVSIPVWSHGGGCNCTHCGKLLDDTHGVVKTLEGQHIVCPGDWIVTGVKGEHYPCKPDVFAQTYEPANAALSSRPALPPLTRYRIWQDSETGNVDMLTDKAGEWVKWADACRDAAHRGGSHE